MKVLENIFGRIVYSEVRSLFETLEELYLAIIQGLVFDLPIYSFTELGKEILTIIDDTEANYDYLKNFATEITKMKEIEVVGGEFIRNGTSVSFLRNDKCFEIPIKLNAEESAQEGSK